MPKKNSHPRCTSYHSLEVHKTHDNHNSIMVAVPVEEYEKLIRDSETLRVSKALLACTDTIYADTKMLKQIVGLEFGGEIPNVANKEDF